MQDTYNTSRLLLSKLTLGDAEFISELVNTPEWIRFIGDRNVRSIEDTIDYIQRIINNPDINYWVVRIKDQETPIGIITFIKREYLEHPDIGFAFLSKYTGQGYAYESANVVLYDAMKNNAHTQILATTIKENISSIQLLEKLGLIFRNEIHLEDEPLLVYSVSADKLYGSK